MDCDVGGAVVVVDVVFGSRGFWGSRIVVFVLVWYGFD